MLWSSSFTSLSGMWLESSSALIAPKEAVERLQVTALQQKVM